VTTTPEVHLVPASMADEKAPVVDDVTPGCSGSSTDEVAGVGALSDGDDDLRKALSRHGKARALLKALPELLEDAACAELMTSLLSHSNEAIRLAVHSALQQETESSPAQEPRADVDQTQELEVAELQDSSLTPGSSSFDRLAFMLNQVPIDVPKHTPTQPPERDAQVAPTDDMKTDVDIDKESEEVGMEGPEQVTDGTGHTPNAIGTRTDAGEDWCLL